MKNPKISAMLKYYRKLNRLTVDDVAKYLNSNSIIVATKTIYGWESGQTQPDADTLMYLCRLYKIEDILGTFGYQTPHSSQDTIYTVKERKIIDAYREHPDLQLAIDKLLDL